MEINKQIKYEEDTKVVLAEKYIIRIINDINSLCNEIITMLKKEINDHLKEMKPETKVFYYWLIGDHYRYQAEVATAEEIGEKIDNAQEMYKLAALEA